MTIELRFLWKKLWFYGKKYSTMEKTMVLYGKNYGTMDGTMKKL